MKKVKIKDLKLKQAKGKKVKGGATYIKVADSGKYWVPLTSYQKTPIK
jgi:hypothetical protein